MAICFGFFTAQSQVADTTTYRLNKVKEVQSFVHFLGFERQDTCLFQVRNIDSFGKIEKDYINYGCQGWNMTNTTHITYDSFHQIIKIRYDENDEESSEMRFAYDELGRAVLEINQIWNPYSTSITQYTYFGPLGREDSVYVLQIIDGDSSHFKTINSYKNDLLKKSETYEGATGKIISMYTKKYDEQNRPVRTETYLFREDGRDAITNIVYDRNGRVGETNDEVSELAAHFFYDENGLLALTHYFNRFGSLEREVWHKYLFYE